VSASSEADRTPIRIAHGQQINLLAYDGSRLYSWFDTNDDLKDILQHIDKRIAVTMNPSEYRVKKMKTKGYLITNHTNVKNK
jgi:hypothetical protein